MKNFLYCRRTFVAITAILALFCLGYFKGTDVAMSIASIAIGIAGANSYEKAATSTTPVTYGPPANK